MSCSIVRWTYFMPRSSDLESLMILSPEDREILNQATSDERVIYLGEIAGKHSDVSVVLRCDQFEDVDCPDDFPAVAAAVFGTGTISGIDLLGCLDDDDDDDDDDDNDDDDDWDDDDDEINGFPEEDWEYDRPRADAQQALEDQQEADGVRIRHRGPAWGRKPDEPGNDYPKD